MNRFISLGILSFAVFLPACSSQAPEPEQQPIAAPSQVYIPKAPPPFVDVLPEFKKSSRAFLDLAKKLDAAANTNPPPLHQAFWKESVPLEEIYTKVINNDPKSGPGSDTFERINKIRDSLFKTQKILKNTEDLRSRQISTLLESEADKRKALFEEADFFWGQTPNFTKREEDAPSS